MDRHPLVEKGKEIHMKGIWKKVHRKTAVALVASMLATSILPITGLAKVYDVNGIFGDGPEHDLSGYLATASVAAKVTGDDAIILASGSNTGEAELKVQYDIEVKEFSNATPGDATPGDATASNADWPDAEADIEEEILRNLSMTATVSNADDAIAEYVDLNTDKLYSDGNVFVNVDVQEADMQKLAGKSYEVTVLFTPELEDGALDDNIVVTCDSEKFTVTVTVEGENPDPGELLEAAVELKGFHGETEGSTWIYVGDEPVDLHEYCTTDPAGLTVEFTSGNPEIAKISDQGILTPVANGEATVTAKVVEDGYEESTAKLKVSVWTYEDMPDAPVAFELSVGEERKFTFTNSLAKDSCVLDMNGEEVSSKDVKLKINESDGWKSATVTAKTPGSYQLKLVQHVEGRVTYVGIADFTVKATVMDAVFQIGGFHGEKDDANGVTSTWTYREYGSENLRDLCSTDAVGAVITFTSSDENVATIDGDYLIPNETGRTTITATMEAPGYKTVKDTLNVDVWTYEEDSSLPEAITLHEGETWTYSFAEPLSSKLHITVFNEETDEVVGEDILKVSVSEDRRAITIEAKQIGDYYLQTERHKEAKYTTYVEGMYIAVLKEGVKLEVPVAQLVLEPDETVSFDVSFAPEDAKLELDVSDDTIFSAVYEDGKISVTGILPTEYGRERLKIRLVKGDEVLAGEVVFIYVAEKQLEATTVEEVLAEANAKVKDLMKNGSQAEIYKAVNEVVAILAEAPQSEIAANKDAIDSLEDVLGERMYVAKDIYSEDVKLAASGALLNLASMGEYEGKLVVRQVEDAANTTGVTLDIKFLKGSNGESMTELEVPMQLRIKVPGIDLSKKVRIKHTKEDGSINWIYPAVDGEYLVFWVDSYSTFAISNVTTGGGSHSGGGGGGGGSSSKSVSGTVSSDAKKGYVNSLTGIITGSAAGYSRWNQDETGWKLQYADGTFAAGTMLTDANGKPYEQVAWEMINGAWYPFGANGYVQSGLVYDVALGGTFYVDISTGMKTGWQLVDGVWRYFNTVSDGKRGIMLTDTTIDGYYIDAEGVWRQ